MRNLVFIILSLIVFVSCNPGKRIQRIAEKHGEHVKDTLHIDTLLSIPESHFDTVIEKEIAKDTANLFIDTTNLVLEDGTVIRIIDSTRFIRNSDHHLEKLQSKKAISVNTPKKDIPFSLGRPYDKIEVNPPDKIDILMSNFKWAALMALAIALIITTIRKLFQ